METTKSSTGVNSLSAEPTRVKAYSDAEMMNITNELSRKGFKRVQNAYWVEHWSDGKNTVIVERCDENEKPTTPETEITTNTETTMTTTATTSNVLTLGKYAYIFHWSNSTYFYGTKDQRAEKGAINKALKTISDNPDKGVNLPYTVDASGRVLVEVDGLTIAVNDKMIAGVSGAHPHKGIINNRVFKPLRPFYDSFKPGTFAAFNQYPGSEYFFGGAKMKSFCIDSFAGADNLNYYRVSFRNNRLDFITANGKVYAAGGDNYSELTPVDIINTLQAESNSAHKIILALFDYLTA